jgi:DNA-binding winged helix-turn-helix (wHTH) protein
VLHFGEYVLDVERRALQSGAREIALRPQAMEVLCYLARNPGRPVSKEEIFREIWPGVFVTDDSLVQCIGDIRRALGDDDHRIVKTVPRRGYLFAGGVAPDERAIAPTTGLAGGPPTRSRMHEIRLALIGAAAIVAIWAIVHWVVSAR